LTNKRIILSSLIRKENPPAGSNSFGKPYYLITGRGKRYQRNFSIYDLAEMLPIALVVSGEIEFAVNHPNVHAMGKWLIDSEMETLIKNASAVFCIYSEGSQSGIIEQSLSHGVPVVATNVGGLREQIREGVDGFLIDDISEILDAHIKLQKLDRARVGKARSELSLYETLKEESFFLA
jgi:glycosyltransferase involved in cell wall biosynthesis